MSTSAAPEASLAKRLSVKHEVSREDMVRVNFIVPASVRKEWKSAALRDDKTLTELIVGALDAYLAGTFGGPAAASVSKPTTAWLVVGFSVDDDTDVGGQTAYGWVESAWSSQQAASERVTDLTNLVVCAAAAIGAPSDLIGLTHKQRSELQGLVHGADAKARLGRHGVRWAVEQPVLRDIVPDAR